MKKLFAVGMLAAWLTALLCACASAAQIDGNTQDISAESSANGSLSRSLGLGAEAAEAEEWIDGAVVSQEGPLVTPGTDTYRGFTVDNVLHAGENGDIHYNLFVPDGYDGSKPYALFFTLPGYEGLYFQGAAANIRAEEFGFEAQKYHTEMIIVAPQLNDWSETSANQTIVLAEYFLKNYNIDPARVYANGYSGGGETMSLVMGKRPDLFAAYLHCSSKWDGDLNKLAESRTPVYLAVGRDDEYYGSEPTQSAYDTLYSLYQAQGLSEDEIGHLLVLDIKERSYFTAKGVRNEHGGGGLFARDEQMMNWLFSKAKRTMLSGTIPEELEYIPEGYTQPSAHPGTLERLEQRRDVDGNARQPPCLQAYCRPCDRGWQDRAADHCAAHLQQYQLFGQRQLFSGTPAHR